MIYPFSSNIGFSAAGGSRTSQTLAGFNSYSGTATEDIMPSRLDLVSRARQLDISSPLAAASIDRMVGGIIGTGLNYAALKSAEFFGEDFYKKLTDGLKRKFKIASVTKQLDAQGRQTFFQMQELACRNWLLSGDVFFVRYPNPTGMCCSWRAIESDRCIPPFNFGCENDISGLIYKNPETGNIIIDGVELDESSRPVAYWFLKDYVSKYEFATDDTFERIPATDDLGLPVVIHLFKPYRPDQYRGVPLLSGVIETLFNTRNYEQAELQAALFQASFWGFITSSDPTSAEDGSAPDLDERVGIGEPGDEPSNIQLSTPTPSPYCSTRGNTEVVSAGQVKRLRDGEDVKFLQSSHPNNNFSAFIKEHHLGVASAIGIPIQVLECSYDGTYASARGSVLEANRTFKIYRSYFIETFVKPMFEVFCYDYVRENIAWIQEEPGMQDCAFVAKALTIESVWEAPVALCLDPVKEIEGWAKAIEMGLVTRDEAAVALYGHKAVNNNNEGDRNE